MRNRTIPLVLSLALILALGAAGAAGAAPAKRKAGLSKSAAKLTPSERAGIPPEAFGSPVTAPDRSLVAWITDVGQGANIFVADSARTFKRQLTHYHFTPANDQLPGLPLLWSPDGKLLAYFEYRHSAGDPITSSKAVVVAVDGSSAPVPVSEPGRELNTRPAKWLSASELKFKGLKDSSLTGGEESFVWDLRTGQARTEADYLAALAAARAAADSLARAAADSAARAAAPRPAEKEKKERKKK